MSAQLNNRDRDELLERFQKMILRAPSRQRDFKSKFKGALYSATLTGFGRCIVRNVRGNVIVSSAYGWLFEVTE